MYVMKKMKKIWLSFLIYDQYKWSISILNFVSSLVVFQLFYILHQKYHHVKKPSKDSGIILSSLNISLIFNLSTIAIAKTEYHECHTRLSINKVTDQVTNSKARLEQSGNPIPKGIELYYFTSSSRWIFRKGGGDTQANVSVVLATFLRINVTGQATGKLSIFAGASGSPVIPPAKAFSILDHEENATNTPRSKSRNAHTLATPVAFTRRWGVTARDTRMAVASTLQIPRWTVHSKRTRFESTPITLMNQTRQGTRVHGAYTRERVVYLSLETFCLLIRLLLVACDRHR